MARNFSEYLRRVELEPYRRSTVPNKYYIAYGSNLNKQQMIYRCPDAKPVGKFLLTSARLVFRGVADVEFDPAHNCPCGLWKISERDELALDTYEGVSHGLYFKTHEIKMRVGNKVVNPLIYLMRSDGIYPPSKGYVSTIRKGYEDFGLDMEFLEQAIKHSFKQKELDDQVVIRRIKQRKRGEKLVEMPEGIKVPYREMILEK